MPQISWNSSDKTAPGAGMKAAFWSSNLLDEELTRLLQELTRMGTLQYDEEGPAYRWNPEFDWELVARQPDDPKLIESIDHDPRDEDPLVLAALGHDGHYLGTCSPGESPAPGSIVCPNCQHASTRADERHVCDGGWTAEARGDRVEHATLDRIGIPGDVTR